MKEIELVVKIDEETYENLCKYSLMIISSARHSGTILFSNLIKIIASGIPLPINHGPLKDIKQIGLTDFEIFMCNGDYKKALEMLLKKIEKADTIIEERDNHETF